MEVPVNYAFYNIWFEIFCIIVTALLLHKQRTAFNDDDAEKAFGVVLCVQMAYYASFIPTVLSDIGVLPRTQGFYYFVNIVSMSIFAYCGYRAFIFLKLYHGTPGFKLWLNPLPYALPFLFNLVTLISCPWTGAFFTISPTVEEGLGPLWRVMVFINCCYPMAGLLSFFRSDRWRAVSPQNTANANKEDLSDEVKVAIIFPLIFIIFGASCWN